METNYRGLLFIGDPHLEARQPGFRKDDYPEVILEKLARSLEIARREQLLPAILGDLFDKPRDNPNWLISRLFRLLDGEILGLYGNHDVHYNPELTENDSLMLLAQAGRIRLLDENSPWRGVIGGREVIVGGSSYRQPIPKRFTAPQPPLSQTPPLVIWLTHHDVAVPGYDEGRLHPREIEGVDLVINGHIHRRLEDVVRGRTRWLTPGNIARRSRSDASRDHTPAVLRLLITPAAPAGYQVEHLPLPHRPFEEVFHEAVADQAKAAGPSAFVAGLAELQARRTAAGAGLAAFLDQNVHQFPEAVAAEILTLAKEIDHENQAQSG